MTISTSGSLTTENASSVIRHAPPVTCFASSRFLSATTVMRIGRPARRAISSALRCNTVKVPPPTVPIPRSPTLIGFISSSYALFVGRDESRPTLLIRAIFLAVAFQKTRDAPDRFDQVIHTGQEHHAEMI